MKWISVNDKDPPKYEEILFCTADKEVWYGQCEGHEKLRKCTWKPIGMDLFLDTDSKTEDEKRVTHWMPIPEASERLK
jgi:hypothetical protein